MRKLNDNEIQLNIDVDYNNLQEGEYHARVQYIIYSVTDWGASNLCIVWETNKRRSTNNKHYIIKQYITGGENFNSIFYFEDFKNYADILGKTFKIQVKIVKGYSCVDSAQSCDIEELNTIIPIKEDWTYSELSKFKTGQYILFPDGTTNKLQTYIDAVEQYELEQLQLEKNKNKLI